MKTFSFVLLVCLTTMLVAQIEPEFGQIWHKSDLNPVFVNEGDPEGWNNGGTSGFPDGHALWDGENYRLYFTCESGDSYYSIGLFISPHLDSLWVEYENNPVFAPDPTIWDSLAVMTPHVIKDGDIYKMWYSARIEGGNRHIGYAESSDGIDWDRLSTPVLSPVPGSDWESVNMVSPCVIKENDTSYTMWYNAGDGWIWQIGVAHSSDGINWTRPPDNLVIENEPGWSNSWVRFPLVLRTESHYTMWFTSSRGNTLTYPGMIETAVSIDGVNWQRDELFNPVLPAGIAGAWDERAPLVAGVFLVDGYYKMLYLGIDNDWDYTNWGVANYTPTIVPAGDVSGNWTKAGSPIRVQGEITISNGETLTIEPGTTVEFLGHDLLNVQGQILAVGTEEEPIRFWVDDTSGYAVETGTDGVWAGIKFDNTSATNDSSLLVYCDIEFGKAVYPGTSGRGINIIGFSKLRVANCMIQYNRIIHTVVGGYVLGAGIQIKNDADPEILNNTIQNNYVSNIANSSNGMGGGILVYNYSDPLIQGNIIRWNSATELGGGLCIWGASAPDIIDNLIIENTALGVEGNLGYGGGVSIGDNSHPIFMNNTIADNQASLGGGGVYFFNGEGTFINTIIADNTRLNAAEDEYWGHQMAGSGILMSGNTINIYNTCLEGGEELIQWGPTNLGSSAFVNFVESITVDPQLRWDYQLGPYSQCIGSGAASVTIDPVTYEAPAVDIYGNPRPQPAGSNPDMGAREHALENPTGVDDFGNQPDACVLSQNYPNPFNPTTTISYTLPELTQVRLSVFDIRGQEVMTLQDKVKSPGNYQVQWNGVDQQGGPVSTGVYFARLQAGSYSKTIKMVYLR